MGCFTVRTRLKSTTQLSNKETKYKEILIYQHLDKIELLVGVFASGLYFPMYSAFETMSDPLDVGLMC